MERYEPCHLLRRRGSKDVANRGADEVARTRADEREQLAADELRDAAGAADRGDTGFLLHGGFEPLSKSRAGTPLSVPETSSAVDARRAAYQRVSSALEKEIRRSSEDLQSEIISSLIEYIIRDESVEMSAENGLPEHDSAIPHLLRTAVVSSPASTRSEGLEMFDLQKYISTASGDNLVLVVTISLQHAEASAESVTLSILQQAIAQLREAVETNEPHGKRETGEQVRSIVQNASTRAHHTIAPFETLEQCVRDLGEIEPVFGRLLPVVVVLHNAEYLQPIAFRTLTELMIAAKKTLSFRLILSSRVSPRAFHDAIPLRVAQNLALRSFSLHSSYSIFREVMNGIVSASPQSSSVCVLGNAILSGGVVDVASELYFSSSLSASSLVSSLALALLRHCATEPASFLVALGTTETPTLDSSQIAAVSALSSVQKSGVALSAGNAVGQIQLWLQEIRDHMRAALRMLELYRATLTVSIPLHELYIRMMGAGRSMIDSKEHRAVEQHWRALPSDTLRETVNCWAESLESFSTPPIAAVIKMLRCAGTPPTAAENAERDNNASESPRAGSLAASSRWSATKRRKAVLAKAAGDAFTDAQEIRRRCTNAMRYAVEKLMRSPFDAELPLSEAVYVSSANVIRSSLLQPRIQDSLLRALKQAPVEEVEAGRRRAKRQKRTPREYETAALFGFLEDKGRVVSTVEWLEWYKKRAGDAESPAAVQARFVRGVSELESMGLIKQSVGRKDGSVECLTY